MSDKYDDDGLEFIPDYEEQVEASFSKADAENVNIEKRIKNSEKND